MIQEKIKETITLLLREKGLENVPFTVERPASLEHGDYATNVALAVAKRLKKNSHEIAEMLATQLHITKEFQKVVVVAPGFINFFLSRETLLQNMMRAATDESWGRNDIYREKTIVVEYTDPNPFKEFHIGHLMSNAMGESISRLLELSSARVVRANYQGDVGLHVAKSLWAMLHHPMREDDTKSLSGRASYYGRMYVLGEQKYAEDTIAHKEIDVLNEKIYEKSDKAIHTLYAEGRKWSLEHFEELYRILGTTFDVYFFESESGPKGIEIVRAHPEMFEKSDGATIFRAEKYGLHTRVFINSLGLPTYEAKDLGLVELKRSAYPFDTSLTITANEQNEYFKVVLQAAELIFPELKGKLLHRSHGMLRFRDEKMSSRTGNVITGESLLRTLQEKAKEKMQERKLINVEEIAQQVAVGAIKYAVLKQRSGLDIVFDPQASLSFIGDSGPYLQYAHTRTLSLIDQAKKVGITAQTQPAPTTPSTLEHLLIHFPEIIIRSALEYEPHYLTTYLTELASVFSSWYASERVIGGSYPSYGLLLTQAVERTLRYGLFALGIPQPKEM